MTCVGPALFEQITGYFADGSKLTDHTPADQIFLSVRDNLQRILNSRRGALAHLPDYGLDDLSTVYHHLPSAVLRLKYAMETTLLTYEPRLRSIDIEIDTDIDTDIDAGHQAPHQSMLLSFTMVCRLRRDGLVRFGTEFTPDGRARLHLLRAAATTRRR